MVPPNVRLEYFVMWWEAFDSVLLDGLQVRKTERGHGTQVFPQPCFVLYLLLIIGF